MRTFSWYIFKNLFLSLLMALGIIGFVMLSTHFFRVFAMMSNGVSPWQLFKMILYLLPDVLRYAIPLAMLVSSVLVFSRMSADNEIVAMKSSGIGLWQIISPAILLAAILCVLGYILCFYLSPDLRYKSWQIQWNILASTPLQLIESGTVTKLSDNVSVRIGSRDDKGLLHDVHLYELNPNTRILRDITARSGILEVNPLTRSMELLLNDFTVTEVAVDQKSREKQRQQGTPKFLTAKTITIPIIYQSEGDKRGLTRKAKMMNLPMLMGEIRYNDAHKRRSVKEWLSFHERLALALSPLAFMLLGIPFGITNKRSESSSGLIICVMLSMGFYAGILLADALEKQLGIWTCVFSWLPSVGYEIAGIIAIWRLAKH